MHVSELHSWHECRPADRAGDLLAYIRFVKTTATKTTKTV